MLSRVLGFGAVWSTLLLFFSPPAWADLTPKQRAHLNAAVASYAQGDPFAVTQSLAALIAGSTADQIAEVDAVLAAEGLASSGELLAQLRFWAVQHGVNDSLPKTSAQETVLILPVLAEELAARLSEVQQHPAMNDHQARPGDMVRFEQLLWDLHILENQLLGAHAGARFAVELSRRVNRRQLAQLPEEAQAVVDQDYTQLVRQVGDLQQRLEEWEMELRAERLALARLLLERPELTAEKFRAAFYWQHDATILAAWQEKYSPRSRAALRSAKLPQRDRLQDPEFFSEVQENARTAEQLAGPLTLKSHLLHLGLHWWLRGRYGQGTDAFGLAKSTWALQSPEGQFGLFMPRELPKPTDPSSRQGEPVPRFDRRHHYWWAWEDRRVIREGTDRYTSEGSTKFTGTKQTATLSSFW